MAISFKLSPQFEKKPRLQDQGRRDRQNAPPTRLWGSSTPSASVRCRRRFHEHPNPARSKRQRRAKEKGFSSSSQSVSIFPPAFTDDHACSVSWLCGNSRSCYLSKITQQYCHLLSTAAHVFKYISALRMIGNRSSFHDFLFYPRPQ